MAFDVNDHFKKNFASNAPKGEIRPQDVDVAAQ
jgi:hypothetical protein